VFIVAAHGDDACVCHRYARLPTRARRCTSCI
jgi:ribosomal protein L40E